MNWKRKLSSRKFWAAVAAMLSSIGTTIAGLNSANPNIVIAGIICTAASSAAYAIAEAIADAGNATVTVEHSYAESPDAE